MEMSSLLEKNSARASYIQCKSAQLELTKDHSSRKNGQQNYFRKRDFASADYGNGKKSFGGRCSKLMHRNNHAREKACGQVEEHGGPSEVGSLFHSGSKKQNITHLLDWWGPSDSTSWKIRKSYSYPQLRKQGSSQPFNKEHYLQANCQFVVLEGVDYSVYNSNPDLLVEWKYIEEVWLHVSEPPSCPICLHLPVAARITKCGHIYCYPCILHYLALSDKKWRKCPICYDAVVKEDLKSVVSICYEEFNIGDEIELTLMCRGRDSLVPVSVSSFTDNAAKQINSFSNIREASHFTKLLVATKNEICSQIIARDVAALESQFSLESDQPESCFIQEAISLLKQRAANDLDSVAEVDESALARHMQSVDINLRMLKMQSEVNSVDEDNLIEDDFSIKERPLEEIGLKDNGQQSGQKQGPKQMYYFYQTSSGSHIYLHALNVQMLVHEYGSLEECPKVIKAKIVDKESMSMTEELRQRLRYLRHLPLTCQFQVVELAFSTAHVSQLTIAEFHDKIALRQKKRNRKIREERKVERRAQAEEDRIMGRSKSVNFELGSLAHFPTFHEDIGTGSANEGLVSLMDNFEDFPASNMVSPGTNSSISSVESTLSGMSFAQMTREGHQNAHPKKVIHAEWSGVHRDGHINSCTSFIAASKVAHSDSDDETGVVVPEFKHTFREAVSKALDSATVRAQANSDDCEDGGKSKNKKGKKKKNKQVILFSSGSHL